MLITAYQLLLLHLCSVGFFLLKNNMHVKMLAYGTGFKNSCPLNPQWLRANTHNTQNNLKRGQFILQDFCPILDIWIKH